MIIWKLLFFSVSLCIKKRIITALFCFIFKQLEVEIVACCCKCCNNDCAVVLLCFTLWVFVVLVAVSEVICLIVITSDELLFAFDWLLFWFWFAGTIKEGCCCAFLFWLEKYKGVIFYIGGGGWKSGKAPCSPHPFPHPHCITIILHRGRGLLFWIIVFITGGGMYVKCFNLVFNNYF